jgi:Protein of unknown function (DUF1566)/PEP-CTERM motif
MSRLIVPRSDRKASAGLVKNGVNEKETDMRSGWRDSVRRWVAAFLMAGLSGVASVAHAAFIVRGDAVFDDATGLLWERAVNKAGNDVASWVGANAYAEGLTLEGKDDWRLPTIGELENLYLGIKASGVCTGYFGNTVFDCTGDRSPFIGIQSRIWSATLVDPTNQFGGHYAYDFADGRRLGYIDLNNDPAAWAVRAGDVPEPGTLALLGLGLAGLGLSRRRRAN